MEMMNAPFILVLVACGIENSFESGELLLISDTYARFDKLSELIDSQWGFELSRIRVFVCMS